MWGNLCYICILDTDTSFTLNKYPVCWHDGQTHTWKKIMYGKQEIKIILKLIHPMAMPLLQSKMWMRVTGGEEVWLMQENITQV